MSAHYLIRYTQTGTAEEREALRAPHIAYRKSLGLPLAGPLLSEAGDPVGSVIIVNAENYEEAEKLATDDPYVPAGILRVATIERLRIVAMRPPAAA